LTRTGSVGVPIPCAEIKLADVSDMDYFAKNNQASEHIDRRNVP